PDSVHRRGDPVPSRGATQAFYKHGLWGLNSSVSPEEPFSKHLEELISVLEPKRTQLLTLGKENSITFYCSLFSQIGFDLLPDILRRIADLGATLSVVIYQPD